MHASKDLDAKTENNKDVEIKEEVKLSIGRTARSTSPWTRPQRSRATAASRSLETTSRSSTDKRDLKADGAETTNVGAVRVIGVKKDLKENVKGDASWTVPAWALVGKADVEESVDDAFTELVGGVLFIKTKADYGEGGRSAASRPRFSRRRPRPTSSSRSRGAASFSGAKVEIKGSDVTIEATKIILLAGDAEISRTATSRSRRKRSP